MGEIGTVEKRQGRDRDRVANPIIISDLASLQAEGLLGDPQETETEAETKRD